MKTSLSGFLGRVKGAFKKLIEKPGRENSQKLRPGLQTITIQNHQISIITKLLRNDESTNKKPGRMSDKLRPGLK